MHPCRTRTLTDTNSVAMAQAQGHAGRFCRLGAELHCTPDCFAPADRRGDSARRAVRRAESLTQTVILIRHGEKEGDDLSPRGEQRASCLARHFADAGITHLFAYTDHPSKRSVETVTPLAKQLGSRLTCVRGATTCRRL